MWIIGLVLVVFIFVMIIKFVRKNKNISLKWPSAGKWFIMYKINKLHFILIFTLIILSYDQNQAGSLIGKYYPDVCR